jgi:hypothetical protein
MKREQWDNILTRANFELGHLLADNSDRMMAAFEKNDKALVISLTLSVTGYGAFAVNVKPSISYTVEKVRASSEDVRIELAQEPLPGMPEETKPGRKRSAG